MHMPECTCRTCATGTRAQAEQEIDAWFERYAWLGRMNLMALADAASEKRRQAHVERLRAEKAARAPQLRDTESGRAEALALERDGD